MPIKHGDETSVRLEAMREIIDRSKQWLWLLYLVVGVLATGGYFLLPSATAQNVFIVLIDLTVVAAIAAGIRLLQPSHPLPWYLLAFGMTLVVAGDVFWAIYSLGVEYLYPSIADLFYIGSMPLFVAGLLLIGRGGIGRNGANLIDPLILAVGTGILCWSFIVEPGTHGSSFSLLERLLSVTYLFVYVVLLAIVVRPLFIPAKRTPALYLLCSSVMSLIVGDLTYGAITSGTYEAYAAGSLIYAWFLLCITFLGAAALHPSMTALSEPPSEAPARLTWWRLVLLSAAMLLAPAGLALQAVLGQPIDVPLIVVGSAALFSLVTLRMAGMNAERKTLEQRLEFQAFHDPLTRLPNRTLFTDRFEQALARSERQGGKVAVMFVDLDDFKEVNDSLGHEMGDRVLIAVAKRLRVCLRPADTAARLGGDEFTVLLEDVEDAQGAVRVAERILEELRTPVTFGESEMTVGSCIGIALGDGTHDRPGDLLRKADLALYRAKGRGKAGYEVFEPGLEDKISL
jgi:diguanylate cyclase (GGDEF)-like protein